MNIFKRKDYGAISWPEIICVIIVFPLLGFFAYVFFHENEAHPVVNKIVKAEGGYELSDTLLLCTQTYRPNRQYFSVLLQDSTTTLKPDDICIHCGKKLSEHHTEDVWLEKQITDFGKKGE